ncbi:MAG: metallophosphoesterase [Clostridiales bacterium]|jgi:putative phosphoesterase|nr:metallophosphoesterase [Clostridiales bacterium]
MKILVFSDSHRFVDPMKRVLRLVRDSVSMVVHLGDGYYDALQLAEDYPGLPFHLVAGNCDHGDWEDINTFHVAGKKFIMVHGHMQHVKSGFLRLSTLADEMEADVCLFGHTHVPTLFYWGTTLMMNPGTIGSRRGQPTYGVIEMRDDGCALPSIVSIGENGFSLVDAWTTPVM